MAWTRGEVQHEKAYSIAITGNFHATSERIPRESHILSRVPFLVPAVLWPSNRNEKPSMFHRLAIGESTKIIPKIDANSTPKLIRNRFRDHPWGTQIRAKLAPMASPESPWAPEGVPGASRGSSGASRGIPGNLLGIPREAQEALRGLPGTPGRGLGDPFGAFRRRKCGSEPEFGAQVAREACPERCLLDFRVFGRVVQGALSERILFDFKNESAKPDPHETSPTAIHPEGRPFRSESTRSSEEPSKKTRKCL